MRWLLVGLAVLFWVVPAVGEDPYIGVALNDIYARVEPFYFSPKHLQFLYDQDVFGVSTCIGIFPPVTQYTRWGAVGCEQFRSQTPNIQPEVCDLTGSGSGPNLSLPPFASHGLSNAKTPAGNSGWYEWWIRLPKKPSGEINIVIQCGVVKPNAFTAYGFDSVALCAAETGERIGYGVCVRQEVDPGVSPVVNAALPKITAIAYPGPYNDFTPFNLTAFKNPSSYMLTFDVTTQAISNNGGSQVLDGSSNTRIMLKACMDKSIVAKLPTTGQMNALGQSETDLEAGDLIQVRMDIPRQNTVDVYCHLLSAKLVGIGEAPFSGQSKEGVPADAAAIVGSSGGIVQVTDPASPINGATLEIPAGALASDALISVSVPATAPNLPPRYQAVGEVFEIGPSGTVFDTPVTLKIPLPPGTPSDGQVQILSYRPESDTWQYVPTTVDWTNQVVVATITHLSRYRLSHPRYEANKPIAWRIKSYPSNKRDGTTEADVDRAIATALRLWEYELRKVGIRFEKADSWNLFPDITIEWTDDDDKFRENITNDKVANTCVTNAYTNPFNLFAGLQEIKCYDSLAFKFDNFAKKQWAVPRTQLDEVDVQDLVTHEIGHALGLDDIDGSYPIMGLYGTDDPLTYHRLFPDDTSPLRKLYDIPCKYEVATLNLDGPGIDFDKDGHVDLYYKSQNFIGNPGPNVGPVLAAESGGAFCGWGPDPGSRIGALYRLGITDFCSLTKAPNYFPANYGVGTYYTYVTPPRGDLLVVRTFDGNEYYKIEVYDMTSTHIRFRWAKIDGPDCSTCRMGQSGINDCPSSTVSLPQRTIGVDGLPVNDWNGIDPVLFASLGDSTCGEGTDVRSVYLAKDASYLYWRMDTWSGSYNIQGGKGPGIVFYALSGTGQILRGIEGSILGTSTTGSIAQRSQGQDWTLYTSGPDYGKIAEVAEGKIPLTLFQGYTFNSVTGWYFAGITNTLCDQASRRGLLNLP